MDLFIIFLIGFAVSFFSSFAGGVLGMLSLSSLLALGLSPHVALGTFRLGAIGFSLGGLYQYFKANKIVWELVLPLTLIGIVGSVIGINIILAIDERIIEKIVGFVILLFIPLTVWKPHLATTRQIVSIKSRIMGHVSFLLASIWGGSITIGTGFIVLYSQMYLYGLTMLEVKGTNRIPNLVKTIVGLGIFAYHSLVDWRIGLLFAIGMFAGSFIGTHYAIKLGDAWLRSILLVAIGLFSIKLILGL